MLLGDSIADGPPLLRVESAPEVVSATENDPSVRPTRSGFCDEPDHGSLSTQSFENVTSQCAHTVATEHKVRQSFVGLPGTQTDLPKARVSTQGQLACEIALVDRSGARNLQSSPAQMPMGQGSKGPPASLPKMPQDSHHDYCTVSVTRYGKPPRPGMTIALLLNAEEGDYAG
ncbi:hypothetical protein Q7P35_008221 [Cladosporium inversicolor]